MSLSLQDQFGQIDIYVFDQILRGRILPGMRILDTGCGYGRNLVYLLREGYDIYAVDADPASVSYVRELAAVCGSQLTPDHFHVARIEQLPFADNFADVVLCNSVLHFAESDEHFQHMLAELWRVLRPGGLLFCRLGSRIGMHFEPVQGNFFRVGDGQTWYLVDAAMLTEAARTLGAVLLDPIKTTVVQDYRSMTTWVVGKPG